MPPQAALLVKQKLLLLDIRLLEKLTMMSPVFMQMKSKHGSG